MAPRQEAPARAFLKMPLPGARAATDGQTREQHRVRRRGRGGGHYIWDPAPPKSDWRILIWGSGRVGMSGWKRAATEFAVAPNPTPGTHDCGMPKPAAEEPGVPQAPKHAAARNGISATAGEKR